MDTSKTAPLTLAERNEIKIKQMDIDVRKMMKVVGEVNARLNKFEPTQVEKMMDSFRGRVKVVDTIIKNSVLRATVATELSFMARGADDPERQFINSDVIFALDLPTSFWEENYCEERTIKEWIALVRKKRLGNVSSPTESTETA